MELSEEQQERVDIIKHKLKFIEQKPVVACIKQLEPLIVWDDPIAALADIAGGVLIAAGIGQWDDILEQNPDVLIVMPQGSPIEQTMKAIGPLLQLPGFADLKAVGNKRLYIADADKYFNNSAGNLVDSIELLAEIINPKQFIFGYEGDGWVRFSL